MKTAKTTTTIYSVHVFILQPAAITRTYLCCACREELLLDFYLAHFLLQFVFLGNPRAPLRFNLLL
jgi:hypothetical protein